MTQITERELELTRELAEARAKIEVVEANCRAEIAEKLTKRDWDARTVGLSLTVLFVISMVIIVFVVYHYGVRDGYNEGYENGRIDQKDSTRMREFKYEEDSTKLKPEPNTTTQRQ